jgi:hypothetical protein
MVTSQDKMQETKIHNLYFFLDKQGYYFTLGDHYTDIKFETPMEFKCKYNHLKETYSNIKFLPVNGTANEDELLGMYQLPQIIFKELEDIVTNG